MKKFITVLVCINLFAGSLWLGNYAVRRFKEDQHEKRHLELAASAYAKDKLLSKSDYVRFDTLAKSAARTKRIPDADFAWMMQAVEPSFRSSDYRMPLVRYNASVCLFEAKNLTPPQKEAAFKYLCRLVETSGSGSSSLDKISAISLAYTLNEKRAIPYLLPLINHKKPLVRSRAKATLAFLGVQTAASTNKTAR